MDHLIYVVDDDDRIREALLDLLASSDLHAVAFQSASEYLGYSRPDVPGCLILDVELPDINGLELQKRMAQEHHPPIIFLTGHGDVPLSVRALKAGAVDFLTKPFSKDALLEAIHAAIAQHQQSRLEWVAMAKLLERFALLTPREREVLPLVVSGLLNKQAAAELGISEITLQIHRGKIMHKMQADSLAGLVRMAEKLGVQLTHSRFRGR